jgi:hypothetical protein
MTVKFKVGDKIYEVTDQQAKKYDRCHVTWMNREVMDKIDAHPFAWFVADKDQPYDWEAKSGNFWD